VAAAVATDGGITLFMVVKVGENLTADGIKETILAGAGVLKLNLDVADPKPVSSSFFDLVAANTGAAGVSTQGASEEAVIFSPLLSTDPTWSITFNPVKGGDRLVTELTVDVGRGDPLKVLPNGGQPGDKAWLYTVRPGKEYTLRLPQDVTPRSYSMKYIEPRTGKQMAEKEVRWPAASEGHYLVTISNFPDGSLDALFEVIKEPSDPRVKAQVPNPFKDIRREFDIRLFLASIGAELPDNSNVYQNELRLVHSSLPKRNVKRVWALFPVAEAQLDPVRAELRAIRPEEMPNHIRRSSVPGGNAKADISSESRPLWYEFSPFGDNFERSFTLKDWKRLQEAFPKIYQIVVWEFDNGQLIRPIEVEQDGRSSKFKVVEIENWPRGLEVLCQFEEGSGQQASPPEEP
jgi:hypothetical protein